MSKPYNWPQIGAVKRYAVGAVAMPIIFVAFAVLVIAIGAVACVRTIGGVR